MPTDQPARHYCQVGRANRFRPGVLQRSPISLSLGGRPRLEEIRIPLRAVGRPVAMPDSGVNQGWLSRMRRSAGILQVTYDGHPLYLNGGDTKPGSLKGDHTQEFGGRWYAVPISGGKAQPG